jgi:tetratricopeptide (TPR) repeat protein
MRNNSFGLLAFGASEDLNRRTVRQNSMGWGTGKRFFFLTAFCFCVAVHCLIAQGGAADPAYQAKRQKAVELFNQGKRLEALPLLEELVQASPRDDEMLVALAASLVDHAATLTDQQVAGQERLRARDLLDQAWKLGNTSTLAMNLSELLKKLPESGDIKFSDNPQVEQAMRAGEAAFSRRDFDEAIKNYSRALELEPHNYTAALFIGNTYDKQNQFSKATEWYERAIQLDLNIETAYRYYADMLAKQGDMAKSRTMLIHAAVAEPYNRIVWRELRAWATLNHTHINEVYVGVPATGAEAKAAGVKRESLPSPQIADAWQAYRDMRKSWQQQEFQRRFPQEKEYRHSLAEETEALAAVVKRFEQIKQDKNRPPATANDEGLNLLLKLYQSGLLESYVLFSLGDSGIARDYAAYRAKNRARLEEYMDKFVVPSDHF